MRYVSSHVITSRHNINPWRALRWFAMGLYTLLNRLYGVWQRDCLPDTFVFKTLAIETNLYGSLVEFQEFISQKAVKNVIEPFLPAQHFKRTRISLPSCTDVSAWISHKQWAETSVHRRTHLAVTKWLLPIYWLMYCSIILTNNFRNTILYGKVITIKN